MAKAVVDTGTVTITRTVEIDTWPAGKETTITVVVVPIPAMAEAVMAEVEAVYPDRLTRPNPFVTDVGWATIGPRIVELLSTYVSSTKRALRTRTRRLIWFMIPVMRLIKNMMLQMTTLWILRLLIVSKTKFSIRLVFTAL